jgi:hypothetical protein
MARRFHSVFRPGTESYKKQRRALLNRRRALAEARERRTARPEVKRRAQRQATTARRGLREIEAREVFRTTLTPYQRTAFNRLSVSGQDRVRLAIQQYPDGIPPDVPDPFAGRDRGFLWRLYYSSRARAGEALRA